METINRDELSERLAGDMELLRDLGALFIEDYPNLINKIDNAINSKDSLALKKAAHTLKGSVANFSAQKAYEASYELEMNGKNEEIDKALEAFKIVKNEIDNFVKELKDLMTQASIN